MSTGPLGVGTQNDYVIESAVLSTDRGGGHRVDIKKLITDIDIYEHLDKPYLTGMIAIIDTNNLIASFDFNGAEQITLSMKSNIEGAELTVKSFYVESIINTVKVNQSTETIQLRLLEDIAFQSSVQNVNKVYTGKPTTIITKILQDHLDKDVIINPTEYQGTMKIIVPNLHPLEAAAWIKNKITNVDGLPYYLFSTLTQKELFLVDLGEMLLRQPINKKVPYTYSQANVTRFDKGKHTVIQRYSHSSTEDLVRLIRSGNVGAKYQFYNTSNAVMQGVNFNVEKDAFREILDKNYFSQEQSDFNYGVGYSVKDTPVSSYQSRTITQISSADVYGTANTIGEQSDDGEYKKRIIGKALKNFLTKSPITIPIPMGT